MSAHDTPAYPLYFDYAATTPVDPRVLDAMLPWLGPRFGNAASRTHAYGWDAEDAVEAARAQVAGLIGAEPREIIWTSGATESDNLAIKGVVDAAPSGARHVITAATEHKAVLDACHMLAQAGVEVTVLPVDRQGHVDPDDLRRALQPHTVLCSLMHVNNETGLIHDIEALGGICREHGVPFHVDAVQSAGKLPIDVQALPVDLMSFSAHKVYGPKGIGALYVRRRANLRMQALIHGGGHERGLRSGTLPVHQIVGMGMAFEVAREALPEECVRIAALRDRLWAGLATLDGIEQNGDPARRTPGHLNISVSGVDAESLMMVMEDIAVSSGSACSSASLSPSHVLQAMGVPDELAYGSLRFTLGRPTTEAEVDRAIAVVQAGVQRLRAISPRGVAHAV